MSLFHVTLASFSLSLFQEEVDGFLEACRRGVDDAEAASEENHLDNDDRNDRLYLINLGKVCTDKAPSKGPPPCTTGSTLRSVTFLR